VVLIDWVLSLASGAIARLQVEPSIASGASLASGLAGGAIAELQVEPLIAIASVVLEFVTVDCKWSLSIASGAYCKWRSQR
jgi:hypothetical protein